jgi:hypothetical protein
MIRQNLIKAQGKEIVIHRFLLIVGCADWTRLARVAWRRNEPDRSRALALPDLISIVLISIPDFDSPGLDRLAPPIASAREVSTWL